MKVDLNKLSQHEISGELSHQTFSLLYECVREFLFVGDTNPKIINLLKNYEVLVEDGELLENSFVKPHNFTENG